MRTLILAVLIGLNASVSFAQDEMEAKRQAAEAYVSSEAQQSIIAQVGSPEVIAAQMEAQFPQIPAEARTQLAEIASEEMAPMMDEMERVMIDAVAETFSLEEIEAITAFYETPAGLAMAQKTAPLMQSVFARIGPQMQAAQQRIAERTAEVLQAQ